MTQMRTKSSICAFLVLLVTSCSHGRGPNDATVVIIDGYSQENYAVLDRHLESEVCVNGDLHIDTAGIYFPLQPVEDKEGITVGFSRIVTDISRDISNARRLGASSNQTVCGFLLDSTPFAQCTNNNCRWFELRDSVLQSRR